MINFRHCFAVCRFGDAWRKISRFQSPQSDPPETPLDPHLTYPPDNDLRRLLRFEPHSGAIWLGERRMVLLHTAALTALRHDLITSVGKEHARRLLTRMGYACGLHDAGFAAKTRGKKTLEDMFLVGPQLHMLEGAARVTPVRLEMDAAAGRFYQCGRSSTWWMRSAQNRRSGSRRSGGTYSRLT